MFQLRFDPTADGMHCAKVMREDGDILYVSSGHLLCSHAQEEAESWCEWFNGFPDNQKESIYYILAVPIGWPGPPPGSHRYSGLHFKIGRTRDILKRYQNLRTGTSDDLIIHALQPGSAKMEMETHQLFSSDRRQGEWFAASPQLCKHVLETWGRNRVLPPEHQQKLLAFSERSRIYAGLRRAGKHFDMINPSLNEPWHGSVFVDLVYTSLLRESDHES